MDTCSGKPPRTSDLDHAGLPPGLPAILLLVAALLASLASPSRATADPITVAVDVGHDRREPGAISARGRDEFAFNLDLAHRLVDPLLSRGIAVRQINFDGTIENLAARPQQAAGASFFLSIHHDSVHPDLLSEWQWQGTPRNYSDHHAGFALFVSRANPRLETSLRCASAIGALLRRNGFSPATHHAQPLRGTARPPADAANGAYYYDMLVVLRRATLPAVLFEAGVIKNRREELDLLDPARQRRMADAIATGIAACLYTGAR